MFGGKIAIFLYKTYKISTIFATLFFIINYASHSILFSAKGVIGYIQFNFIIIIMSSFVAHQLYKHIVRILHA